jgi:hypothetical protein
MLQKFACHYSKLQKSKKIVQFIGIQSFEWRRPVKSERGRQSLSRATKCNGLPRARHISTFLFVCRARKMMLPTRNRQRPESSTGRRPKRSDNEPAHVEQRIYSGFASNADQARMAI